MTIPSLPPAAGASPAMAQWFALKAVHPDALLFFRMGDFYELFFTDAEAAAAALDIALTTRGEHAGAPIPMCGVPIHAADAYLARLIRRGFRVAVAEQMEDPRTRTGKAPIRREIVRLITPGTLTEETLLDAGRANLLLALAPVGKEIGAAWVDISTGLFTTACAAPAEVPALLGRLEPAEILAPAGLSLGEAESGRGPDHPASPPGTGPDAPGGGIRGRQHRCVRHVQRCRSGRGCCRAGLRENHPGRGDAPPLPSRAAGPRRRMAMDPATRTSLEILRARDGGTEHTLLSTVKRTLTAAGARLLGHVLSAPLTRRSAIIGRADGWTWMLANPAATERLREALRGAPDMARALGRVALNRGTPRDLSALRDGLLAARRVSETLSGPLPAVLAGALASLAIDTALGTHLTDALADPAPARMDEGAVIRTGFDAELDAERSLRDDSRRTLASLQLDFAQRYGVASLKIRHHAQLGYVIEAPAAAVERLREYPELTLRQGMANGARFTTPELADLDRRISEAGDRAGQRERALFARLVQEVLAQSGPIAGCADALALLDVMQGAARLAEGGRWCRPELTDDDAFLVRAGRHPVVERALTGQGSPTVSYRTIATSQPSGGCCC